MAMAALKQDNRPKARTSLEKAAEISDDNIDVYKQLLDVVDPDEDRPAYVKFGLHLAGLFREIPAVSDAIDVLERVLKHDLENVTVMEQLVDLYVQSEQTEQAGSFLGRIARLCLNSGDVDKATRSPSGAESDVALDRILGKCPIACKQEDYWRIERLKLKTYVPQ